MSSKNSAQLFLRYIFTQRALLLQQGILVHTQNKHNLRGLINATFGGGGGGQALDYTVSTVDVTGEYSGNWTKTIDVV